MSAATLNSTDSSGIFKTTLTVSKSLNAQTVVMAGKLNGHGAINSTATSTVSTPSSTSSGSIVLSAPSSTENGTLLCETTLGVNINSSPISTIINSPPYADNSPNLSLINDASSSHRLNPLNQLTMSNTHDLGEPCVSADIVIKASPKPNQQLHQTPLNEDARTLQLALELSLVGLNDDQSCYFDHQQKQQPSFTITSQQQVHQQTTSQHQKTEFDLNTMNVISAVMGANQNSHNNTLFSSNTTSLTGLLIPSNVIEDRSKKSQNMTECVPVPSSEHVAEIVGRQGCKIKALRAKTNTYIKTPVRGEEPVFVVTGRKEDVNKAKREILSAADHFSLIRATRKPSLDGNTHSVTSNGIVFANGIGGRNPSGPPSLPGQVTIQVRVPYRVVGLVVGPKGATIKHIQQETQTYIVTPSREKEPIFEVTGLPENVQAARRQIESHIALRTGNNSQNNTNAPLSGLGIAGEQPELSTVHTINTLSQILNDDINPDFLASLYKDGICSGLDYTETDALGVGLASVTSVSPPLTFHTATASYPSINAMVSNNRFQMQPQGVQSINSIIGECASASAASAVSILQHHQINDNAIFHHNSNDVKSAIAGQNIGNHEHSATQNNKSAITTNNGLTRSCSSASSTTSTKSTNNSAGSSSNSPPELLNIWKTLGDSLDVDEGIGDSPNIWQLPNTLTALTGSHCSPSTSISPTDSLLGEINVASCQQLQRTIMSSSRNTANNKIILQDQQLISAPITECGGQVSALRRECFVCNEKEVTTALVPCGHNMFCMDCANQICVSIDAVCPVCSSIVYHAMRILA